MSVANFYKTLSVALLQEYGGHFDNCEKSGNCLRKRMEGGYVATSLLALSL